MLRQNSKLKGSQQLLQWKISVYLSGERINSLFTHLSVEVISSMFMAELISYFALDNIIKEWDQRLSPKLAAGEFFKNDNDQLELG